AAYLAECLRTRRVEIDLAERRLPGEVVAACPQRQSATRNKECLEIQDQRAANTAATLRLVDNDRVQLPNQTVVFSNRADPSEDRAVARHRHSADAVWSNRVKNFLARL